MMDMADFVWDGFQWTSQTSVRNARLAAGPIDFRFAPEGRGNEPLRADELDLLSSALDQLDDVLDSAVEAVFNEYPRIQLDCAGFLPDAVPDLDDISDLCELVELTGVHVHQVSRNGTPYLGLEFNCPWDPEHGLGVLMNGTRSVEIGGVDTAVTLWIAERDLEATAGQARSTE